MTYRLLPLLALVTLPLGCGGDAAPGAPGAPGAGEAAADPFERERGELAARDETLTSGEFADTYSFDAEAGQWIEVALTSSTFDPYVILKPPSCASMQGTCTQQLDNDDFLPDRGAFLWQRATEGGRWEVLVTSHQPGETGGYELAYRVVDAGQQPATAGVTLGAERTERGRLESGDGSLRTGELRDLHSFVGRAGDRVTLDLRSTDFDPYLILEQPGDHPQVDNDDWEGSQEHARIETTLPDDGTYRVMVTTYRPGELGAYELRMASERGAATDTGKPGADQPGADQPAAPTGGDPFQKQ